MSKIISTKVLIIGSGPAGYTAAIYAARASLSPILVAGLQPGGQLTVTTDVENYPGFADPVQGPWLMEQMAAQAKHVGTEIVYDMISNVDVTKRPFVCTSDGGTTYHADTVIICTGAQARWLGLPVEEKFRGFGVSACATCDGFFYRGKVVGVVGGGNTAVEEALYLTNHADKVYLIHRRHELRADKTNQARLFAHPKIEMIWDHVVTDMQGTDMPTSLTGVTLTHSSSGATRPLALDGLFVAIGHDPATELFKGKVAMDSDNYILTKPDSTATSVAGVYAAGDVKDKVFRQAVTAAGMGCMAALEAERFMAHGAQDVHAMAAE
jgi:thioredoxin reductase (NADPH)